MSNLTSQKKWIDSAIRRLLLNPVNIALAVLLMVLAYLVLWPFFQLVLETLTWGEGDRRLSRDAVPGVNSLGFIGFRQRLALFQKKCYIVPYSIHSLQGLFQLF